MIEPEQKRFPWDVVGIIAACIVAIVLLPAACGFTCGVMDRAYSLGAGAR